MTWERKKERKKERTENEISIIFVVISKERKIKVKKKERSKRKKERKKERTKGEISAVFVWFFR